MTSAVEYRQMRAGEEDRALALWFETWPGATPEHARNQLRTDPDYLRRTFVAVAPDGALLSTAHYWLRQLRDAQGEPRLVGCVSHVVTSEDARRQGHAARLMQSVIAAMRRERCDWSLLFSSDVGVGLYEGLGYRRYSAPYWQGLLVRDALSASGATCVVEDLDPLGDPDSLEEIQSTYGAYNAARPLSVVRTPDYWEGFFAGKYRQWSNVVSLAALGARDHDGRLCSYLFIYYSTAEFAREHLGLDQAFTVAEIGALPGQDDTIAALLAEALRRTEEGRVGGRMFVPRDPHLDKLACAVFGESLHQVDDRNAMGLALSEGFSGDDVAATFAAPGAGHWPLDEF